MEYFLFNFNRKLEWVLCFENGLDDEKWRTLVGFVRGLGDLFNGLDAHLSIGSDSRFKSIINSRLTNIVELYLARKPEVSTEFLTLHFLLRSLDAIKNGNSEAYKRIRKNLIRQIDSESFFGFVFETRLMWGFLEKQLTFSYTERPDFQVFYKGEPIYVEAGIIHSDTNLEKSIAYKLRSIVNKKNAASYANKNTVLFVDYSNILRNEMDKGFVSEINEISEEISKRTDINFGAIIGCVTYAEPENEKVGLLYRLVNYYSPEIKLREFIDMHYLNSPSWIESPRIPRKI